MLVYWLLYGFPSLLGLVEQSDDDPRPRLTFPWLCMFAILVLLIGFRWETGGDWNNYRGMVDDFYWSNLEDVRTTDPGFNALLWIAARAPAGILVVTAVSGVLMAYALVRFCLDQPRPWLAMAASIPFMVLIMGMGYIRQGMAISLLLLAILALGRGRTLQFILYLAIAATFHSTAVVLAPFAALVSSRSKIVTVLVGGILSAGLIAALFLNQADRFQTNYVEEGMSSAGAAIRLSMTALAGATLLIFSRRFALNRSELIFWRAFSLAPVALLLLLPVFASSTVLDRLGLYFLPVQTFVAGRLPDALGRTTRSRYLIAVALILLYGSALFVWLNYAVNVYMWLPYRSYFLEDGPCPQC